MLRIHPKYLVPNGFTALSMLFGLASVACSVRGAYDLAAWMILWGVLLDKLDGTAARLLRASSDFGVQFDSFADFVAFGIAPASLVFFRLADHAAFADPLGSALLIGCAGVYVVAVAGRLARFNISSPPMGDRYFYGLPTTLMGAVLASLYLTWEAQRLPELVLTLFPLYLLVAAAAMVSSIRLPKLKMRKSKLVNAFQIANVVVAYVVAPLRVLPEYLLALSIVYIVIGVSWCLLNPPGQPEEADLPEADLADEPDAPRTVG